MALASSFRKRLRQSLFDLPGSSFAISIQLMALPLPVGPTSPHQLTDS